MDCNNGADEKGCLSLAPKLSVGSYIHQYHSEGYLLFQKSGRAGKVCTESFNTTGDAIGSLETVIETLANGTCSQLEYGQMSWAVVGEDQEKQDIQYVGLESIMEEGSPEFQPVQCQSRMVVRMQ